MPLAGGKPRPRTDPAGKGRLLWWHENLVAGVDVLGVCAHFLSRACWRMGFGPLDQVAAGAAYPKELGKSPMSPAGSGSLARVGGPRDRSVSAAWRNPRGPPARGASHVLRTMLPPRVRRPSPLPSYKGALARSGQPGRVGDRICVWSQADGIPWAALPPPQVREASAFGVLGDAARERRTLPAIRLVSRPTQGSSLDEPRGTLECTHSHGSSRFGRPNANGPAARRRSGLRDRGPVWPDSEPSFARSARPCTWDSSGTYGPRSPGPRLSQPVSHGPKLLAASASGRPDSGGLQCAGRWLRTPKTESRTGLCLELVLGPVWWMIPIRPCPMMAQRGFPPLSAQTWLHGLRALALMGALLGSAHFGHSQVAAPSGCAALDQWMVDRYVASEPWGGATCRRIRGNLELLG